MVAAIIKALLGGGITALRDWQEAKLDYKIKKMELDLRVAEKKIDVEADWDIRALEASKTSWKDEYLTIIFTLPYVVGFFIAVFFPELIPGVERYFKMIGEFPYWWQWSVMGIVAASFGLRWWFSRSKVQFLKETTDAQKTKPKPRIAKPSSDGDEGGTPATFD